MSANSFSLITQRENKPQTQNETDPFQSSNWKWWTGLLPALPWPRHAEVSLLSDGTLERKLILILLFYFFQKVNGLLQTALQGFFLLVMANSFEPPHLDFPLNNYRYEARPQSPAERILCSAQRKFYHFCLHASCPDSGPLQMWKQTDTKHKHIHIFQGAQQSPSNTREDSLHRQAPDLQLKEGPADSKKTRCPRLVWRWKARLCSEEPWVPSLLFQSFPKFSQTQPFSTHFFFYPTPGLLHV